VVVDNIMPYFHQIFKKKCLTDVIDKYNIFYCEFRILEKKHILFLLKYSRFSPLRNTNVPPHNFVKYCCNVLDSLRKCGECNGNYLKKPFWDFSKVL
jgi:hypothetical protein